MRVAMAQINSVLGDFKFNAEKILDFTQQSLEKHCRLVVFPEACLFGYHPTDLLERKEVVGEQGEYISWLGRNLPDGISILIGAITKSEKPYGKLFYNSAVLIENNKPRKVFSKQLLPTYDVFDEGRHIEPGNITENIFQLEGQKILVTICEDIWEGQEVREGGFKYKGGGLRNISSAHVDLVVNLSASPFTRDKVEARFKVVRNTVEFLRVPLLYVNLVGGQDELVFDGGSFVMDKGGEVVLQSAYFEEDLNIYDTVNGKRGHRKPQKAPIASLHRALVVGIRDFVNKTGFKYVHLGLSGGIDSALVACLSVDAVGSRCVTALAMPSRFNSANSLKWAMKLASRLGITFQELPISDGYQSIVNSYEASLGHVEFGLVHENIQSRLRSLFLMAYSNHRGSLLLNTSNKSEMAVGYSTLYGDMSGGLCPIGDLLKRDVYSLCQYYNRKAELIPKEIIERPPSAELRPDQKDEDSLPIYSKLDESVQRLVEKKLPPRGDMDRDVLKMLYRSEFKRWQAPPILKVTNHGFGRGRRFPVAGKFF